LTPYLEIGGDYREVLPGVFIFELPLPFSLGIVNVYLVRLPDGWMLVDTGMNTEPCFDALDRAREGSDGRDADRRAEPDEDPDRIPATHRPRV